MSKKQMICKYEKVMQKKYHYVKTKVMQKSTVI